MAHEGEACAAYYELLELIQGKSVLLEEYARELIVAEETARRRSQQDAAPDG